MSIADCLLDADGYSQEIRRSIVDKAMTGVRAHSIEPHAEVLALYARYVVGTISRQELDVLISARLQALYDKLVATQERGR